MPKKRKTTGVGSLSRAPIANPSTEIICSLHFLLHSNKNATLSYPLTHFTFPWLGYTENYRTLSRGQAVIERQRLVQIVDHWGAHLSWSHAWVPCLFRTWHWLQCLGWPYDHLVPTLRTWVPLELHRFGTIHGPFYTWIHGNERIS